ncbi:MAG: hypothetical protein AB1345_06260 [Chloroflexota bacterium]
MCRNTQLLLFWERFLLGARTWVVPALELSLLALAAMWVGREYLNLTPRVVANGREFGSAIQTHHIWTLFKQCGICALWNGFERGGYPAFVDLHGSMLHPLVMGLTLLLGVVNGVKLMLVMAIWFAGVGQWWLSRELGLSRIPRLWSSLMAVFGGYLSARMELGAFGVVLSIAMCSLVYPAVVAVARRGGRRTMVLLGVTIASAIVAGQGYIQIGLLVTVPAFFFLLFDDGFNLKPVWKEFLLAVGLALLLAGIFLIPTLHFLPNFVKETDPTFRSAQPLAYVPLNLVINEIDFYWDEALSKFPYPHLYANYIGWVAVVLAVIGVASGRSKDRRLLYVFSGAILLQFLVASGEVLRLLVKVFPSVAGVRHPPQIAALAVPLILGLAAYGLERLLRLDWPVLWMDFKKSGRTEQWRVSAVWVLVIPLVLSLHSNYIFSRVWYTTSCWEQPIYDLLGGLETPDLQWVEPPFGEHFYVEPAISMGFKLSPGIMSWRWKDREFPIPVLEANRAGPPPGPVEQVNEIDGIPIYARNDQPYAAVVAGEAQYPCTAQGAGGYIEVSCQAQENGRLVVKENMWSGWKAWRDGERVMLQGDNWLEVEVPAGNHTIIFRYLPWDVVLGLVISVVGVVLCIYLWRIPGGSKPAEKVTIVNDLHST